MSVRQPVSSQCCSRRPLVQSRRHCCPRDLDLESNALQVFLDRTPAGAVTLCDLGRSTGPTLWPEVLTGSLHDHLRDRRERNRWPLTCLSGPGHRPPSAGHRPPATGHRPPAAGRAGSEPLHTLVTPWSYATLKPSQRNPFLVFESI